ncbi:MAG: hypothetical protein OEQ53_22230, partial [Saprospiraceae bacterium]|nr:hypothetical protein [Saprospiraceae bacterium]
VNIASRIESLAEPGQIIVTESVCRNLLNKKGIDTEFLGERYLKNVSEPWRLYKLNAAEDLLTKVAASISRESRTERNVPNRFIKWMIIGFLGAVTGTALWMSLSSTERVEGIDVKTVKELREKTVAVLPFEGPTSGNLAVFGDMAPYWITRRLLEVTDGKVVDVGKARTLEDIPVDLIRRTGLDAVIMGRYFALDVSSGQLEMFVDIVDLHSKEKRSLGKYTGMINDPSTILDKATQTIMAIWALGDRKRWSQAPPRYDAFKEYKKSEEDFGTFDFTQSIFHLVRAYEMDTTFYEPLLKMCSAYSNMGQHEKTDSILQWIRSRNPVLDTWTEMRMEYHVASLNGDNRKMSEIAYKIADYDLLDGMSVYMASFNAVQIGDCQKAMYYLGKYRSIAPISNCVTNKDGWVRRVQLHAYFCMGDFQEILDTLFALKCIPDHWQLRALPLKASVRLGQYHLIDSLLNRYRADVKGMEGGQRDWLLEAVVKELYAAGEEHSEQMARFSSVLARSTTGYEHWGQIFSGSPAPAIEKLEQWVGSDPDNMYQRGHLAFMYAFSGDTARVLKMFDVLEATPEIPYNLGQQSYALGLMQSVLGNRKEAMSYLVEAQTKGKRFGWHSYSDDFRLRKMFDYPPFQDLVQPKGQ